MSPWWLWSLAALVSGIIEVMSVSFVFLMLAIGALAAGIAAACGANLMVQLIVFIVVSVALLVVLRPFLKGRIERSNNYVPSNTDLADLVHEIAQDSTPRQTLARVDHIETARKRLVSNGNPLLVLEDMAISLRPQA